ncbi:hypothetical protein B0J13DRAFT_303903 [Dactylonectria estremocensis]|uniref:Uncharacterized protein n=1 Tax=Dactylonectria estremocensis TaxID=1079267 RepID=A0A9P9F0L1_9HYPO|nr:hypothetical protein B0J13DRAFT_303903 [Dactylonectria estremocensis]
MRYSSKGAASLRWMATVAMKYPRMAEPYIRKSSLLETRVGSQMPGAVSCGPRMENCTVRAVNSSSIPLASESAWDAIALSGPISESRRALRVGNVAGQMATGAASWSYDCPGMRGKWEPRRPKHLELSVHNQPASMGASSNPSQVPRAGTYLPTYLPTGRYLGRQSKRGILIRVAKSRHDTVGDSVGKASPILGSVIPTPSTPIIVTERTARSCAFLAPLHPSSHASKTCFGSTAVVAVPDFVPRV